MTSPTIQELDQSIQEITEYHDRLHSEVTLMANKLRMPKEKIESTVNQHSELTKLREILLKLTKQRNLLGKS